MEQASILESIPYLLKMPSKRMWVDYDDEADTYISGKGFNLKDLDSNASNCIF